MRTLEVIFLMGIIWFNILQIGVALNTYFSGKVAGGVLLMKWVLTIGIGLTILGGVLNNIIYIELGAGALVGFVANYYWWQFLAEAFSSADSEE